MKKRMLAVTMATAMVATTACSGGSKPAETTAAPAAAETTAAESKAEATEGSTEPVTLKIANYAVLEKGYEEFWTQVKNDYEAKYPNVKFCRKVVADMYIDDKAVLFNDSEETLDVIAYDTAAKITKHINLY